MSGIEYPNMREAVAAAALRLAERDPKIVVVCPDSIKAMRMTSFAARFPDRIFDVGIAEQQAVSFAVGLASCGFRPIVATYAGFLSMRACEQLRTFVGYTGLDIKFVGANGGIAGGEREGTTHQFFEDLAIVRAIPGFRVLAPCDPEQAGLAFESLFEKPGPAYLRVAGSRDARVLPTGSGFTPGAARICADHGNSAAIFACGGILSRALRAAAELKDEGFGVCVVEVHTIKPLDDATVAAVLSRTGAAVTLEDHSIVGGLGGAISEAAAAYCPVPMERLGLRDVFPESGEGEALLDKYGMSITDIKTAARAVAARKRA
jgi:transketolase